MKRDNHKRPYRLTSFLLLAALSALFIGAQVCNDMDWDDIADEEDNCPEQYNPLQANEDTDALGDACDPETPMHGHSLGRCYRSNWQGFTGTFWDDIQTTLTPQDGSGIMSVKLLWPDMVQDLLERGPGRHNGHDIWFMTANTSGMTYFATFVEGAASQVDEKGVISQFTGSFTFLECEECWPDVDEDDYESWEWVGESTWTADIMPPGFCDLEDEEPYFDDDVTDDDTADDDTADDDTIDDDDTTDDDDSAGVDDDSDGVDDDDNDRASDDDDDDDQGACGC
ncbi:MAG: hypothetical protein P9L99_18525 [Candidatus Lernaella stagnicola]|nr:hypothetical protein [Candidatus Lernaella stagnicola]